MSPVRTFARVDVAHLSAWISSIPLTDWPQQHPVDHQLRPAMVDDLSWHAMGFMTNAVVERLLYTMPLPAMARGARDHNRLLSVVMPGHDIHKHCDPVGQDWIARVHVPLTTNPEAVIAFGPDEYLLDVGSAYLVDIRQEHAVVNRGDTPRIHFMFDVRR